MSGLDTLAEEGLDLQMLEGNGTAELMEWHPASRKPDADITVLCWLEPGGEWFSGWWDGESWLDAAHGGPMEKVTHWAEPKGPGV